MWTPSHVVCWGSNVFGQTGSKGGLKSERQTPRVVQRLSFKNIIHVSCGCHLTMALGYDDCEEILGRACLGEFGHTKEELLLLSKIVSQPGADSVQQRLRRKRASHQMKKIPGEKREKQLINPASQVAVTKYSLSFGLRSGLCFPYKYVSDFIFLRNNSRYPVTFTISDALRTTKKELSHLKINPKTGSLAPNRNVRISFELVLLSLGSVQKLLTARIDVDDGKEEFSSYTHFLSISVATQSLPSELQVNFKDISHGEVIGTGAAGDVLKVQWKGKTVAVKSFKVSGYDREVLDGFRNEVIVSSYLNHKNICRTLAACMDYPHCCLVMEYLHKGDLRKFIEKNQPPPNFSPSLSSLPLILRMCLDLCSGMVYLHRRNVLHRDIKPENVLLVSTEENAPVLLKLTDFGTSGVISSLQSQTIGTVRYCAPELLRREQHNEKVDVYSASMLFFEMMVGHIPFDGIDFLYEVEEMVIQGARPRLPPAQPPFEMEKEAIFTLIARAWRDNPSERPPFSFLFDEFTYILQSIQSPNSSKK